MSRVSVKIKFLKTKRKAKRDRMSSASDQFNKNLFWLLCGVHMLERKAQANARAERKRKARREDTDCGWFFIYFSRMSMHAFGRCLSRLDFCITLPSRISQFFSSLIKYDTEEKDVEAKETERRLWKISRSNEMFDWLIHELNSQIRRSFVIFHCRRKFLRIR